MMMMSGWLFSKVFDESARDAVTRLRLLVASAAGAKLHLRVSRSPWGL